MKNNLKNKETLQMKLTDKEYEYIRSKTISPNHKSMPLISWDIFMENYHNTLQASKKKVELTQVTTLAKKYNWQNDLELVFSKHDYEALIITDINQNIIWVNEGFTNMTGYSQKYAINKTPRFLQGAQTSVETKNRIREKIQLQQPFKEVIINHKKDKTTYKCEVNIIPLYSEETTHFIALEKQVV
ncbi:PAS domain-containing protein [Kordia sp.]|uniref:PAS domain-containing protein n=1 Tax=Kordia sp. TaxID=1965332 RepID=UPI0025C20FA4|nr:PAS domain-containing protein [Kordia sp.]MCH2193257.1 PAS domain-containing protein [Kordia sp.]